MVSRKRRLFDVRDCVKTDLTDTCFRPVMTMWSREMGKTSDSWWACCPGTTTRSDWLQSKKPRTTPTTCCPRVSTPGNGGPSASACWIRSKISLTVAPVGWVNQWRSKSLREGGQTSSGRLTNKVNYIFFTEYVVLIKMTFWLDIIEITVMNARWQPRFFI